ncbi:hypothetical protein [Listeria booriae]|nr:hypothetical protein [Listeria booriae]
MAGRKSTWRGAGKAALAGAGKGLMWTGLGRSIGFISKGKAGLRLLKKGDVIGNAKRNVGAYGKNIKRMVTNPSKHFKNSPGKRYSNLKKILKHKKKFYKKYTQKHIKSFRSSSNAIRRIK